MNNFPREETGELGTKNYGENPVRIAYKLFPQEVIMREKKRWQEREIKKRAKAGPNRRRYWHQPVRRARPVTIPYIKGMSEAMR